jgi:hypothetical protein
VVDRDTARRLVAEEIGEGRTTADGITPVIVDDRTIEREFGWVFFYDSKEYLATGDISHAVLGNAPVIVDRRGSVHHTGTAHPVEHYIRQYERSRGASSG